MGEVLFTTNDVAKILRVDKSTVKRWTDEGKLQCFRTPGGHRKFRSEDLYNFIAENNYGNDSLQSLPKVMSDEMIIRSIVQKREYNLLHSVCFSSAIKGKKDEILSLFKEIHAAGLSVASIFDHVVRTTVKKLHFLSQQNKISVSEYHLAVNGLTSAIIRFTDTAEKLPKNHKTVVCASITEEKNGVEFLALTSLLEINGYAVLNLGSGIHADAIRQFLLSAKPYALCLYSTDAGNSEMVAEEMVKIADAVKLSGAHCVAGGPAFQSEKVKSMDGVKTFLTFAELDQPSLSTSEIKSIFHK